MVDEFEVPPPQFLPGGGVEARGAFRDDAAAMLPAALLIASFAPLPAT